MSAATVGYDMSETWGVVIPASYGRSPTLRNDDFPGRDITRQMRRCLECLMLLD
jgi:hypothetical protein